MDNTYNKLEFTTPLIDFTVESVCKEIQEIEDYFELGYSLLYDSKRIKEAIAGEVDPLERKKRVIQYWMGFDTATASWEKLARVICDCMPQHKEVAARIRAKYVPNIKVVPLHEPPVPSKEL